MNTTRVWIGKHLRGFVTDTVPQVDNAMRQIASGYRDSVAARDYYAAMDTLLDRRLELERR